MRCPESTAPQNIASGGPETSRFSTPHGALGLHPSLLPHISSAGDKPVELCGVIRYLSKRRESLVLRVPDLRRFIPSLNVCMALSMRPVIPNMPNSIFLQKLLACERRDIVRYNHLRETK